MHRKLITSTFRRFILTTVSEYLTNNDQIAAGAQSDRHLLSSYSQYSATDRRQILSSIARVFNPLTPTVAIWVQIMHPVPDRIKPPFVILTSGHSDAQP